MSTGIVQTSYSKHQSKMIPSIFPASPGGREQCFLLGTWRVHFKGCFSCSLIVGGHQGKESQGAPCLSIGLESPLSCNSAFAWLEVVSIWHTCQGSWFLLVMHQGRNWYGWDFCGLNLQNGPWAHVLRVCSPLGHLILGACGTLRRRGVVSGKSSL